MNEEDGKIRKTDEGTGVIEEEKKEEEKEGDGGEREGDWGKSR